MSGAPVDAVSHYRALFDAPRDARPAWLEARCREAIEQFCALGLPTRKLEEWRYTNIAPIERARFTPADAAEAAPGRSDIDALGAPEDEAHCAVFVNGRLAPALSRLPADEGGLRVTSLRAALAGGEGATLLEPHLTARADFKDDAFTALNTAFIDDGAVVSIPAGCVDEPPVRLLFVTTGAGRLVQPRVLVVAGRGSQARIAMQFAAIGAGASLVNAVTEVTLEANAQLDLLMLQQPSGEGHLITNLQVAQERDSRFASHTLTLDGAIVRNELGVALADEGASTRLNGLFFATGAQHVDNHTLVDHAMPHCTSDELYKGVLSGEARGVFRGRVLVRPGAQKTDARQSNPNLITSNRAEIDTKPQLEIYADDVKCSHGSTIGQLDEDALFFMRSRGLGQAEARALLTRGFAHEITEALPTAAWTDWAGALVHARLRGVFGEGE